jgi:hypothetical protein
MERLNTSLLGWVNHARYGNTVELRKAIIRKRISQKSWSVNCVYNNYY